MFLPLFDSPDEMVYLHEIQRLSYRHQAAWSAFCVGLVGPLLPPSFHARIPFDRCVHFAWAAALGQPVDAAEARSISAHLEDLSAIFGQGELPPDFSGYWLEEERYGLRHWSAVYSLLQVVLTPDLSAVEVEAAVEAAGSVYQSYQTRSQGFWGVIDKGHTYSIFVRNVYYAVTRKAYEVALCHGREPDREMFAAIEFQENCTPLDPELARASREVFPLPPAIEAWFRESGRWRGLA